jgi:serine protease inhibitor
MAGRTQVLVLVGVVGLANLLASVTGANRLVAAEADRAAVEAVVAANTDFAINLYKELAKEKGDRDHNLFFSPYSMSGVLTMAAEGARGETAAEMGKVLCFPAAARRVGDDAKSIPWNVTLMHQGMAGLNARFNGPKAGDDPKVREKIKSARKRFEETQPRRDPNGLEEFRDDEEPDPEAERLADELNKLLALVDQYELNVANALWVEKTYPCRQSYLDAIRKSYADGGVFTVDFKNHPESARLQINAWMEKQTSDRIRDLIPPKAVNALTRLVLTNAVYFKGEWAEVFLKERTREGDFLLADRSKVRVPMMQNWLKSGSYAAFKGDGTLFDTPREVEYRQRSSPKNYPDNDGFEMLEMPYKGNDLAMVVVVPRTPERLPALEKLLTSANLRGWIGKLQKRMVDVCMPRFRFESVYRMNDALAAMGIARAFLSPGSVRDAADFSGMCAAETTRPGQMLYIDAVLHKSFIEVNEKGTEAAVASGLRGRPGIPKMVPFSPRFRADKPFLFLIRDKRTGCILFLGRVMNPRG